jgi:cytochrome c-type biogenesis protein CcmF
MLADIGLIALTFGFLLSVYATFASAFGGFLNRPLWSESARNSALLVFPVLSISVLILVFLLYTLDFSIAYVYDVSSKAMSPFLRVTALWGGQSGSVLFWGWMMSGFVAIVLRRKWQDNTEMMPYVTMVSMLTTAFFVGLVLFITNPFARLWYVRGAEDLTTAIFQPANSIPYIAEDGGGLNPLLRHFGMIGHPPTTYLGFTGFVIPYAFAIAALITGKAHEDEWIRTTRRWTLVAWIFLTIGLVLGGRWAYDVLGWGGFWGWDPVENAMLMPWLTGTAFLHSVMLSEKRGMLKVWNIILIVLTYSLALFGTFITRTGVIGSVHAFSKSAMGPAFFLFIGFTFLSSLGLLFSRLKTLKTENEVESFISREAAFLLQNMLFLSITVAVFWGTVFPMLSELVTETKITVGPPYFQKVTGPLFAALVLLMSIAPFLSWRKQTPKNLLKATAIPLVASMLTTAVWGYIHRMHPASFFALWLASFVTLAILYEFWRGIKARMSAHGENPFLAMLNLVARNHRRYGGYIIHIGVILIGLAFIGDAYFKIETQKNVTAGQTINVAGYTLKYEGVREYPGSDGRDVIEASTSLYQNGRLLAKLNPRKDFFVVQKQPVTIPGVYSTASEDVYVLLAGFEDNLSSVTFKIYVNPLVNLGWAGAFIMTIGTLIAAWPTNKAHQSYVLRAGVPQTSPGD